MKGRWAAGIEPRNFSWILKDQLAVSERPGGFAPHHRRVRRQEEILWLNVHGFTRVVSLLPSNHNLHAYDELHIPSAHFALPSHGDARPVLTDLYGALWSWLHDGERVLLHQDELGEQVAGVVAGFLCWSRLLPEPPRAVSAVEQLLRRQMGHAGRSIVAVAADMPAGQLPRHRAPARPPGLGGAAEHPMPEDVGPDATSPSASPPPLQEVPALHAPGDADPTLEAGTPVAPDPAPVATQPAPEAGTAAPAAPAKASPPRSAGAKPSSVPHGPKKATPAKQAAGAAPAEAVKEDAAKPAATRAATSAPAAKSPPAKAPADKAGSPKKAPLAKKPPAKKPAGKAQGGTTAKKAPTGRRTGAAETPLGDATRNGRQR